MMHQRSLRHATRRLELSTNRRKQLDPDLADRTAMGGVVGKKSPCRDTCSWLYRGTSDRRGESTGTVPRGQSSHYLSETETESGAAAHVRGWGMDDDDDDDGGWMIWPEPKRRSPSRLLHFSCLCSGAGGALASSIASSRVSACQAPSARHGLAAKVVRCGLEGGRLAAHHNLSVELRGWLHARADKLAAGCSSGTRCCGWPSGKRKACIGPSGGKGARV